MNLNEIQSLIKFVAKSGVSEVELETKDFKITIKSGKDEVEKIIQPIAVSQPMAAMPAAAPAPAPQQAPAATPEKTEEKAKPEKTEDESRYVTIKSPMIGTFYRSPNPDSPPFVNVGDTIKPGDTVCIIEAMKLFNEIESEVAGKIVKVLVDDATPVEYDQPLFLVDPS
jgi:acetyl-CoA carboxylase biotin carboxyl carrier protein